MRARMNGLLGWFSLFFFAYRWRIAYDGLCQATMTLFTLIPGSLVALFTIIYWD